MPTSPYSLTTTAVPAPSASPSSALIRVVLPEPRKPVTATTGSRGPRGRFCRRPKSGASDPANGSPGAPSEVHLKSIKPSDVPIDRIDDTALVGEYVVYLDRSGRGALRRSRDKVADFLRLIGVGRVEGAQPAIEEGGENDAVGLPRIRLWQVFVEVVRAIAAASALKSFQRRQRASGDWHRICLEPSIDNPHQFGPIAALHADAFVADDQEVPVEEGHHGVGEAVIGRMVIPARHHHRVRHVGNVEDNESAVDIAEIGTVGALGI